MKQPDRWGSACSEGEDPFFAPFLFAKFAILAIARISLTLPVGNGRIIELCKSAPLPQLDRGTDYESVRRGFESLRARHLNDLALLNTFSGIFPFVNE